MRTNWAPVDTNHGVIVVDDEAGMEPGADAWISVAPSTPWFRKIVAWVMVGDEKQLAPFIASPTTGKEIYNELGHRLGVARPTRTIKLPPLLLRLLGPTSSTLSKLTPPSLFLREKRARDFRW